jgi:hypothetical protein
MKLTPAIKGQLTKIVKAASPAEAGDLEADYLYSKLRVVFLRHMPPEQAKHATRKYLSTLKA